MIVGVDEVDYVHFECPNTIEVTGRNGTSFFLVLVFMKIQQKH